MLYVNLLYPVYSKMTTITNINLRQWLTPWHFKHVQHCKIIWIKVSKVKLNGQVLTSIYFVVQCHVFEHIWSAAKCFTLKFSCPSTISFGWWIQFFINHGNVWESFLSGTKIITEHDLRLSSYHCIINTIMHNKTWQGQANWIKKHEHCIFLPNSMSLSWGGFLYQPVVF